VQVEAGHGSSDDGKAARDALFALLGAGVLVAGAPAKRRKALGLLAILAVLALFLWRRVQAATESAQVAAPESERETEPSEAEASEQPAEELAEELAVQELVAEVVEEPVAEETVLEETAAEEVADEVEPAAAEAEEEAVPGFEALDAALAALIGELERVDAARREEAQVEEAQRAWREAQAEDAREHELAEAQERDEAEALIHAGRQLVHAGGSDIGGQNASAYDLGEERLDEHGLDEHGLDEHGLEEHGPDLAWHQPEEEGEPSAEAPAEAAESEVDRSDFAEVWHPDPIAAIQESEPVAYVSEVVPQPDQRQPVEPQAVVEPPTVAPVVPQPQMAPQPAPAAGGLIGLIGRYSHRGPGAVHVEPPIAEAPAAAGISAPAPEVEHTRPTAAEEAQPEEAGPASPESDWL
jgi:hypothetical protein